MINLILKALPNNFGKRSALLISGLALATVIINLVIISYIEYNSSFKTVQNYINSQYEVTSTGISDAIITDDIYALYSTIENMAKASPYIDNITVLDAKNQYVSDVNVTMGRMASTKDMIIITKNAMAENKPVGKVLFYINKGKIIRHISENIKKLFIINFIIVIIGTIIGLYLIKMMTRPLIDLTSQIRNLEVLELPYNFKISRFASSEISMLKYVIENLSIRLKNAINTINYQQKEISRSERLAYIGTMSAGLAHELKNPIMSINLILSSFAEEVSGNAKWQEDFNIIKKEADKLVFRINEFLEYSRPVKLNYEYLSTNELIEYIQKSIATHNFDMDIRFSTPVDSDICTDPEKITQMTDILAENSSMAGALSMNIDVSVEKNILYISIADDGQGFKNSDLSKIMLPFYTTKKDGSGLGLAICSTITDAMGGEIHAEDNQPQGAVFRLTLPMPDSF